VAAGVGDVFCIGFQKSFSQLFLGYFVVVLLYGLVPGTVQLSSYTVKLAPLLAQMQNGTPDGHSGHLSPQILSAFVSTLPILLICMIPVTYLSVNWLFTQPLIIDRQMDFWHGDEGELEDGAPARWWHVLRAGGRHRAC
jgi:hypothetical protein